LRYGDCQPRTGAQRPGARGLRSFWENVLLETNVMKFLCANTSAGRLIDENVISVTLSHC